MPDLRLTIEEMVAEGDKVVCRNTWRWTDPSGQKMQFHGFVLWRFEGDKIAERWATVNLRKAPHGRQPLGAQLRSGRASSGRRL